MSSSPFCLDQIIEILIAGIVFVCALLSCWFIRPSYVFFHPILIICLFFSVVWFLLPTSPPVDTLMDQLIKWFWYWKLVYLGLCLYVPTRSINYSFPPILPSYQCIFPVLLMCFFLYVNYPLLSILLYCQFFLTVNAPVCQCFRPLIYYNIDIDSWDFWDCVFSVIGSVRPVDASFPYVVSMLHFYQCSLLSMLTSIDWLIYR